MEIEATASAGMKHVKTKKEVREVSSIYTLSEGEEWATPEDFKDYQEKWAKNTFIKDLENNRQKERQEVLQLFAARMRAEGTEQLLTIITRGRKIYTIRDDTAAEMFIYQNGIYVNQAKSYINEFCRDILGEAYTTQIYSNVLSKIQADTYINAEDFFKEQDVNKVVVENGILNLKTKELESFDPELIFFQKLPIRYDKNADCPKIKEHFNEVLSDESDIKIIQELFGYCLLREYLFGKAIMFLGSGRNGKGVTVILFKHFLGVDNVSNIQLQQLDSDSFSIAELRGKLANLNADLSKTALRETGMFKSLTGGDLISANRKFLPRVNFVNHAKMVFCCNELPITYDLTFAFFNRWILLDFPFTFVSKEEYEMLSEAERTNKKIIDPEIVKGMTTEQELSGLLNWSLEGLHRLLENRGFSDSRTTEQTKVKWLRQSNSFHAFFMDCLQEEYDGVVKKDDLRVAYTLYCREHKLNPTSEKAIKQILSDKGIVENRHTLEEKQIRCWDGVNFKVISQGSRVSHGFSTYNEIVDFGIGKKTLSFLSKLSNEDENPEIETEEIE